MVRSTAKGIAERGFLHYENTDLLAFNGFDGTPFSNFDVDNCQLQCLMSDQCQGYTFDTSKSLCKIKQSNGGAEIGRSEVKGIISGLKQSGREVLKAREAYFSSLPAAQEADLAWRKDDTAQAFVSRIRMAAKPMGKSCDSERAKLDLLAHSLQATLAETAVAVGSKLNIDWSVDKLGGIPPAWLMISTDQPVRFEAPGYYALTPGAIAPFGLSTDAGHTRAMTALFGSGDFTKGKVQVLPLTAGTIKLSVRVVGYIRSCEEEYSSEAKVVAVEVAASATPIFQVRDPFSFDKPSRVLISPAGDTKLEVFSGRFRLVDIATGEYLADLEGTDPNYSPTGRFAAFVLRDNGYQVLDTVDGSLVRDLSGASSLGWENNDSFLVAGGSRVGSIFAHSLLVADAATGADIGCRVCPGREELYALDLENDVVHGGPGSTYGQRLSGRRDVSIIPTEDPDATKRFIAQQTNAAPVYFPVHWNLRGGLKFTLPTKLPLFTGSLPELRQEEIDNVFRAKELPQELPVQTTGLQPVEIGQARGVVALERPKAKVDAVTSRLADLGLVFSPDREPAFVYHDPKVGTSQGIGDTKPAIAKKIMASVPSAKGAFALTRDTYNCNPGDQAAPNGLEKPFAIFDSAIQYKIGKRSIWLTFYGCAEGSGIIPYPNLHFFDSSYDKGFLRIDEDEATAAGGGNIGKFDIRSRLYADRFLLIWSTEAPAMMLFDIDTRKTLWKEFNLGRADLFKEAFYSVENQHVTQLNSDGSLYVYDATAGIRVLEGRYVDDETVAWAPSLQFEASPEGANYVNLRFPGLRGQYAFQQFSRIVRKDGLVKQVLGRTYEPVSKPLGLPPRLSGTIEVAGDRIKGSILATGASDLRIYQDGLLTDTIAVSQSTQQIDVARTPGGRWVSVVAFDQAGLASLPMGRDAGTPDQKPVVHALTIGIDRYTAKDLKPLRYANKDSRTLLAALAAENNVSLRLGSSTNLSDAAATPTGIMDAVERMVASSESGDTILFSFAGHGLTGPDGLFYIATTETRSDDIGGTGLAWSKIAAVLSKAKGRVLVFLDACHSGVAGTAMFAANDGAVEDVLQNGPPGLLVFSASKGRQLSEETAKAGGGVFTNAVADVISRKRKIYDLDGNGAIEASELYLGVKRKVSNDTDGRQVPWFARNELIGDFSVF